MTANDNNKPDVSAISRLNQLKIDMAAAWDAQMKRLFKYCETGIR